MRMQHNQPKPTSKNIHASMIAVKDWDRWDRLFAIRFAFVHFDNCVRTPCSTVGTIPSGLAVITRQRVYQKLRRRP